MGSVLSTASVALLAGYGIARLSASIMQELRTAVFARVQQDAIRRLAREIYRHLLNMDMKFHLSRETGGLVRAVDRGTKGISFILSAIVLHLAPTCLEIGVVCGILGTKFGAGYVYVTLATMVSYVAFTFSLTKWRTKFRVNMNNADNQAASIATDSLLNVEAVKYFNAENYQIEKYDKALAKYHKSGLKTSISLAYLNAGQNIIFSTSLAAMMYMAANGVINGTMSIGDLVMVNGLIFQLSLPLNFLGTVYREMNQAMIDMDTLFNLEKTKPLIGNDESSLEVKDINGSIDFKNVSFAYEAGRPILNDLSFTLPPGKRVAFVGPSGCGKSTILRLLYRFYDVDKGSITIDGIPINKMSLDSLRKSIAIVPQDTVLFNSTIFENIAFGNSEATIDEVIEVSKMARLHALISSLPQGYNTPVGERGLMISGGERQRIALARALLKKSPIILFDEATSALDAHTERSIMNSVADILDKEQCTAIFIAHRLRTIKNFDLIYVLKKGKLVEVGTHDELLKLKGTYFELWSIQEHGNKKRVENLHAE
ncbi:Iron-sulfur clusters transporter ATM1, mitochondrial [Smittium culicis]|uniref:Iron-sulfur clusters transporter ATM1, mitochondrial n=1 Tax=Smittium culicis TaxID=133412 RepID=A0A1R1YHI2_9FUNG|nr:Iron-sulfur clusters transporter ATM1, mitochondrial [Smittium culicis]